MHRHRGAQRAAALRTSFPRYWVKVGTGSNWVPVRLITALNWVLLNWALG